MLEMFAIVRCPDNHHPPPEHALALQGILLANEGQECHKEPFLPLRRKAIESGKRLMFDFSYSAYTNTDGFRQAFRLGVRHSTIVCSLMPHFRAFTPCYVRGKRKRAHPPAAFQERP